MAGTLLQVLANFENMHYFNNEDYEMDRVDQVLATYKQKLNNSEHAMSNAKIFRHLWLACSLMAIIPYSAHLYIKDDVPQNEFFSMNDN